jgi:2-oxoacid:acceptor oxidoreductase delta subunit (pyruvate/2-ketoisovalerate family)
MSSERLKGWKELPRGGVILEAGSYAKQNTSAWRTHVPVCDYSKCIHCLQCWIMCPDSARLVKDGKLVGTDLMHCKGCGICAEVCPKKCIEMKLESGMKPGEPKG